MRTARSLGLALSMLAIGAAMALAPRAGLVSGTAAAQGSSSIKIPFETYTLAQRPDGHHVARSDDADRRGEHVVPRGLEERGEGAHRVRAPLRARDVHRLGPRAVRPARQAHRRRRRLEQRHDVERSDDLLRDRAVELPRIGALDRSRPHGLPARFARSRQAERAARHRQERAAAGRRQPALRPRVRDPRAGDLSGVAPVLLGRHRQHGGPVGRDRRGRQELLPALLRAEQRVSRHRRRLRSGADEGLGAEVLRGHSAREAHHAADGRAGHARRGAPARLRGSRAAAATLRVSGRPSARSTTIASRSTCSGPSCPARARPA